MVVEGTAPSQISFLFMGFSYLDTCKIYIYIEWLGCWMVGLVGLWDGWVYEVLYVGGG